MSRMATRDDGPLLPGTQLLTKSADASSGVDITAAPGVATNKLVLQQLIISVDTAMTVTIEEETSGTDFLVFYMPANGSIIFVPRYPIKAAVANKKFRVLTSVSGNISVHTTVKEEA